MVSTPSSKKSTSNQSSKKAYAEVWPDVLDFGFLEVGQSQTLELFVFNNLTKALSWQADTGGASWLSIEGDSHGEVEPQHQQTINLLANTATLSKGTYLTTLNILLGSVNIHISATVHVTGSKSNRGQNHIGPKSPSVDPGGGSSFSLSAAKSSPGTMTATVSNPPQNPEPVTWKATSDATWLTLNTYSGPLQVYRQPGYQQQIQLIANTATLQRGKTYQATLTFNSFDTFPSESKDPTKVTVQVTVK